MKNLFKGICLVVALMATFAMVGCGGGGGGGNNSSAPVTNVSVNIPLPAATATNVKVRAAFKKDTEFKAYYYNDKEIVQPSQYFIDDASATVIFTTVPSIDVVVKSELNKGNGFKPYYQGLISKDKINGSAVKQKLTPETTAMAMLFEEKAKTNTTLSVADFEYTLEQEKAKGNDVFAILGVSSAVVEKSLTDLTVKNDLAKKVEEAAKKLVITPKPAPQPTPSTGYVDELNKKLAENTSWKTSAERTIYKHLTTGRVDESIPDGGMAAEIIYSTKDGDKWTAPTDKPIIIYDEMGGSHPYCLYKNNQLVRNQQFHYIDAKNLFRYIQYGNDIEKPVEEGLESRELLFSGYYKVEEITLENVTYYRATNTDKGAKDVYFFKLIKRPNQIK